MSDSIPTPKLTYTAVSFALLVPVLIWPVFWWGEASLNPGLDIGQVWLLAAATLLISAIGVDSVLHYRTDHLSPFFAAGWILFGTLAVSMALRTEHGAFLIGCLFALHATRSGIGLWRHGEEWWLWPAWVRDTLAALGMFAWQILLSHV
ncbi:MAG TPA: hypothetical protein VNI58_07085 [Mariprofundaceae bacterium]|nr:hypothetical protein [Mariprofundaceae bacterium]